MAAPIASQVLGEVLPYLEINKDNENEEDVINKVTVPKLEGMVVSDAENILKEMGLNIDVDDNLKNTENGVISEQIPVRRYWGFWR